HKLSSHLCINDIKGDAFYTKTIQTEQIAYSAHHPIGPKIEIFRPHNNLIKHKVVKGEGEDCKYRNRDHGTNNMPPQDLQMFEERHFSLEIFSFLFYSVD